MRGVLANVGL